ncbi:type II secretion system secretin GspD [Niveibacterium terrae]|uniref:type II secretion system secretin GspD n=1 Tax=Niveibacterium terrae TaxID=3373598 RepID=UPI003A8E9661
MTCSRSLRRVSAALLLSLACAVPLASRADDSESVTLNFVNADIDAVIRAIGKITGKNFIVDPRVKGTLNITTQQPVPKALTYQILLSSLRMQGFTAVEGHGVIKILPEVDAKLHGVKVGKNKLMAGGDRIVTEIFTIRNESAAQLVPVVRPLVSPNNTVTAYAGNNTLVVTDYAENVARIRQVINSIDVPQGGIRIIPVQHASALDLANTINKLVADSGSGAAGAGDGSQRIAVQADTHTNSLLVRSDNPSKLAMVRSLVSNLDQPGAAGNIRVIYLKNAEATKVAQTLRAVISGDSSAISSPTSSGLSSSASTSSSTTSSSSGSLGSSSSSALPSSSSSSGSGSGSSSGGGMIQADATSNALIITAPEPIYNNLRKVIDMLDRRRAQVLVEALIVETTSKNATEMGIQWMAGNATNGLYGGTSFGSTSEGTNILGVATSPTTLANGMNVLVSAGSLTINGTKILNLNMLAHFLQNSSKNNILSTPTIVTMDNEEAKILIGQNVPFVTGSYTTSSSTTSNPFTTVERKDVGLTLKLKPQISEGGSVKLIISQESSSVASTSATLGPTTNKRSIDSTVLIDDGSIIALGGLIEDTVTGSVEKVPFFGDLPVLGSLFRYDSRSHSKTNMVVFLRPRILRDPEAYGAMTTDRYQDIIGTLKKADPHPNKMMPKLEEPDIVVPRMLQGDAEKAGSAAASEAQKQ